MAKLYSIDRILQSNLDFKYLFNAFNFRKINYFLLFFVNFILSVCQVIILQFGNKMYQTVINFI